MGQRHGDILTIMALINIHNIYRNSDPCIIQSIYVINGFRGNKNFILYHTSESHYIMHSMCGEVSYYQGPILVK